MVLVYVGAHDLRHCDEVVGQELAIVVANSAHLRQALIAIEEILLDYTRLDQAQWKQKENFR